MVTISRLRRITGLFCRILSLYRALLLKRPIILRSLLIVATPYVSLSSISYVPYGVATMSRMLKNICLFAEYRSLL